MVVLGLGRNYSADPGEEKHMWFNSRSLYFILAHPQSLSESFSHQLRHGREKKLSVPPHFGLPCGFSLGDSIWIFLQETSIPHLNPGESRTGQSGPTSLQLQ